MAYMGLGVWAMSAQQIIYNIVLMLVLFITVKWKPRIILNKNRIKVLFTFGWKILLSGLIDTIWMNVYGLVIGKRFSQTELGGYNRGEQFPKLIAYNLSSSLQSVMLPAFSSIQHDKIKLKDMMKQSIRISSFFVFPMMAGLIAVAEPLVSLLLTDKWLFCVPYMRIMCISYAVWPIHVTNLQVMNAMGRSDIFLKLEIIKKLIGIVVLIFSLRYGIIIMLLLKVLNEIFCTFVNVYPNKKLINYGIGEQYRDMLAPICLSVVMGFITISVIKLNLGSAESLFIQLLVGSIVYALLSWMFNRKTFNTIFNIIKKPSAD